MAPLGHHNIPVINKNVAVDGKKAYMCGMKQYYKEENLNKINFVFHFLRSVYSFWFICCFY